MSHFDPDKMTKAVKDDKTIIVSGEHHIDLMPQGLCKHGLQIGEYSMRHDESSWFCAEQPDIFEMAITQSDFQAEMSDTDLRNEENYREYLLNWVSSISQRAHHNHAF